MKYSPIWCTCWAGWASCLILVAASPPPLLADWHHFHGGHSSGPPTAVTEAFDKFAVFVLIVGAVLPIGGLILLLLGLYLSRLAAAMGLFLHQLGASIGLLCGVALSWLGYWVVNERPAPLWIVILGGAVGLLAGLGVSALVVLLIRLIARWLKKCFGRKQTEPSPSQPGA